MPSLLCLTFLIALAYGLFFLTALKLRLQSAMVFIALTFYCHVGAIFFYLIKHKQKFMAYNDIIKPFEHGEWTMYLTILLKQIYQPILDYGFHSVFYYIFFIMMGFAYSQVFIFLINNMNKHFSYFIDKPHRVIGN